MPKLAPIKSLGKTEQLRLSLGTLCRSLGAGGKLPTVREISASLRVSLSTLDRVLAGMEQDRLIVRRHGQGIFVAEATTTATIAFVTGLDPLVPEESMYCQILASATRRRLSDAGQRFKFYLAHDVENSGLSARADFKQDVERNLIAGALLAATSYPDDLLWLKDRGLPFVALTDCPNADYRFQIDYPWLVDQALERLVARGCRRVCLVSWDGISSHFEECAAMFRQTASRLKIELLPRALWQGRGGAAGDESRKMFGARAVKELFSETAATDRFDGIVCTDDTISAGMIPELNRLGLRPGAEVQFATHANLSSPVLEPYQGQLILFKMDLDAAVQLMLSSLNDLLSGRELESFTKFLKPELP